MGNSRGMGQRSILNHVMTPTYLLSHYRSHARTPQVASHQVASERAHVVHVPAYDDAERARLMGNSWHPERLNLMYSARSLKGMTHSSDRFQLRKGIPKPAVAHILN